MKLNEVLLIGGALLAALVLSKGGSVSSIFKKSSVPLLPLENQNQSKITSVIVTPPQFTRIDITDQLRNISSLELEKNIAPYQTAISTTQDYISQQYKKANPVYSRGQTGAFVYTDDIQNVINKYGKVTDDNLIAYYENFAKTQPLNFRANMYNILIAKRNISKAEIYQERQQESINILEEEYQTRFGGLSRYG
jgi:hypothetical protein|tara:strand:- start:309 stop:890 length:582 start_codon:yes stop_codon:yes gene_type:complete